MTGVQTCALPICFHTISSNSEDYYTKEELEEIGVIEGEIQRLLPDEHIYYCTDIAADIGKYQKQMVELAVGDPAIRMVLS